MSKFYSILAAAVMMVAGTLAANAELKFYLGDSPIASGETVSYVGVNKTQMGSKMLVNMKPEVFLESSVSKSNVVVKVTSLSGQQVQCCAGGQCEMSTVIEKSGVSVKAGEKLDLQFEYQEVLDADAEIPAVEAKIEAWYYLDTKSKQEFVIRMSATAGVEIVEANGPTVKPVAGGLGYSLDGNATVNIYSISGKLLKSVSVSGNGVVSTAELPRGIYLYKVNGPSGNHTGKLTR